jgi:hypothetical protein
MTHLEILLILEILGITNARTTMLLLENLLNIRKESLWYMLKDMNMHE